LAKEEETMIKRIMTKCAACGREVSKKTAPICGERVERWKR
jgi:endogenous inhibitor of DNA gyrase (YacG/DUF329 family)